MSVEISAGTVGEFVTEYLSENGRCNQIIGELSINVSVQMFGLSQIFGRGLPYIVNLRAHIEATGRVRSSNWDPGSGTPGSGVATVIWGVIFYHSTVNWSVHWDGYVNASPADLLWSPICPRVSQIGIHEDFLHRRHQQRLWCQFNQGNNWVCQRRQDRDFSNGKATE